MQNIKLCKIMEVPDKLRRRMAIDNDVANAGLAGVVKTAQLQTPYYVVPLAPQKISVFITIYHTYCILHPFLPFSSLIWLPMYLDGASRLTSFFWIFSSPLFMLHIVYISLSPLCFCQNHLIFFFLPTYKFSPTRIFYQFGWQ